MTQPETESIVNGSKLFGSFLFPQIHDNLDGWGPCEVPEQFRDTPYQPFSKDDRLGKVFVMCNCYSSLPVVVEPCNKLVKKSHHLLVRFFRLR